MRICIVAEGCYPYVVGGVSSWIHNLINSFPNLEFVLLAIVANRSCSGKFVYELPKNVTEVYELYLSDNDWQKKKKKIRSASLSKEQHEAMRSLILNQHVQWNVLFELFQQENLSIEDILMGEDFYNIVCDCYDLKYPQIVFSDFLWTMRSIYLPMFFTLKMELPKADLYHCIVTGYAGVLGSMAKYFYGSRLMISEHGIYTREREEELIKADWVSGIYKDIWIEQFKKMSNLAYENADLVTSLYENARVLQIELGCPPEKTMVTPNGIRVDNFRNLPGKQKEDEGFVNVGAVLRVTPIKDVKTMIQAFGYAKKEDARLKLWIMGPWEEDEDYARECFELVEMMEIPDVVFTGRVNVRDYLGRMDFTLLTSISEGQPLTILESYAAHKPVIATNVGNCEGLIYGEDDGIGSSGILAHIMNVDEIARAIVLLAGDPALCTQMGENGYQRVMKKYKLTDMQEQYRGIYRDFARMQELDWTEEEFAPRLPETVEAETGMKGKAKRRSESKKKPETRKKFRSGKSGTK